MAVLNYKTRGIRDAQGKQKVYFCAHPDDYERYLDKITDEILDALESDGNHNCAFFYLEDPTAERDGEFLFSLKEMNLVIMPVTDKLLNTANPALDTEFRFAVENGIAILPLMMEHGLEDLFNLKCGDLQYLDPNSRDATVISYEEKLKRFLGTVLIGDELAEKIRNAFDAYIFLSYRKKDRKYAQDLMKLIHKNDFCRDIAIWYDEFLVPGENFNKAIEDALEKSKLFTLAVTPSLLEKSKDRDGNECENYIVTTEYPMARNAEKPILPAELVETDKNVLAEKYEGIPACIDAKDSSALSKSLLNAFEGVALRENDGIPEHNYLIGLAYLGGVDVERDPARAVALISSAAETGLAEAMERLVSIYRNGESGKRDYEKAIVWQEKLAAQRKKEYESGKDEKTADSYLSAAKELCSLIFDFRSIDEAESVYKDMLSVSREICTICEVRWAHIQKCYSLGYLADHERVKEEMKIYTIIENLRIGYDGLGGICLSRGALSEAEEYYRKAQAIREKLADEIDDDYAKFAVSHGYERLGDVCFSRGDYQTSKKYYLSSLAIQKKVTARGEHTHYNGSIALVFDNLCRVCKRLAEYDEAEKYCRKAMRIRKKYADVLYEFAFDAFEAERYLSISYDDLGDIRKELGDLDGAERFYAKSLKLRKKFVLEAGTFEDRSSMAISCDRLGILFRMRDDLQKAEIMFNKALEIRKELVAEINKVMYRHDFQQTYMNLGDICLRREDYKGALNCFTEALEINEKLAIETGRVQSKRDLSVNYVNLGIVTSLMGDLGDADEYFEKSIVLQEKILAESDSDKDRDILADLNYEAGVHLPEKQREYFLIAYEIWKVIAERNPGITEYARKSGEVKRALGIV